MLFSSMLFLFLFLPVVSVLYFFVVKKLEHRNLLLLIFSLIFYAWGEPVYVLLMILSILINFSLAELIDKTPDEKAQIRKIILVAGVSINLSFLFVFKYESFVAEIITTNLPVRYSSLDLALPIGISFFTFQALSYLIDVYRKTVPVQKSLINLGLYVSFFPQLIAGPIVRYNTIEEQINKRNITAEKLTEGIRRFIIGLGKKVLLANQFALIAEASFADKAPSFSFAWLGAIAYTLQIFYDFSGYSDMAIGLGKIFGFEFLENFNYPYISKTVSEFWRRWHISLGSWFRDYLYFPLGGSRVKKGRLVFNLFVVWLCTGIWHGASFQFVVWGLMYFVILTFEKLLEIDKLVNKNIVFSLIYRIATLLLVIFGWVIFAEVDLQGGLHHLSIMMDFNNIDYQLSLSTLENLDIYYRLLTLGVILATPLIPTFSKLIKRKILVNSTINNIYDIVSSMLYMLIFFLVVSSLVLGAHNPFIYFNF